MAAFPTSRPSCDRWPDLDRLLRPHLPQGRRRTRRLARRTRPVAEGAVWDGPPMLRLQPGGSLTYDLGRPQSIGAVYLEGDANDTYTLSGSPDGSPGTFKVLTVVANVVERGPGMRARAVQIPPATVRYLRVGDAVGDGAFSIAELAVFCARPRRSRPPFAPSSRRWRLRPSRPTSTTSTTASRCRRRRPFTGAAAAGVLALVARRLASGRARCATPAVGRPTPSAIGRSFCDRAAAVRRQRLRGADLRGHLAAAAAVGDRVVGRLDRRAAGDVHGRHVHRQPGAGRGSSAPAGTRCASTP